VKYGSALKVLYTNLADRWAIFVTVAFYGQLRKQVIPMEKPLAFVIEDDTNLALAFAEALEEAEYKVEIINDGKIALERLADTIPSTVVLDLHIPNVKGQDVLKYIRADARMQKTRVILATADDQLASMVGSMANLVLLKPIGYQQLRDLSARLRPQPQEADKP
jgi:DNA-binding response OmpR family regulator